jgi:uncharacterized membrane protein
LGIAAGRCGRDDAWMGRVGPLQLLVVGFEGDACPPQSVGACLRHWRDQVGVNLLDALVVTRDRSGVLWPQPPVPETAVAELAGSPLWTLLVGTEAEYTTEATLDVRDAGERGLDLEAVERLVYEIDPGTSAVLVLVEDQLAAELLDVAASNGGAPLVYGCLEPETMLVVGPAVAHVVERRDAVPKIEEDRGAGPSSRVPTSPETEARTVDDVLAVLVRAGVIDDPDRAIDALRAAGVVPTD